MCTMEYFSVIKRWNNDICSNMDGPRDYHTNWSKSDRERQIYHSYMESIFLSDTNKFIYKTETDLRYKKTIL